MRGGRGGVAVVTVVVAPPIAEGCWGGVVKWQLMGREGEATVEVLTKSRSYSNVSERSVSVVMVLVVVKMVLVVVKMVLVVVIVLVVMAERRVVVIVVVEKRVVAMVVEMVVVAMIMMLIMVMVGERRQRKHPRRGRR